MKKIILITIALLTTACVPVNTMIRPANISAEEDRMIQAECQLEVNEAMREHPYNGNPLMMNEVAADTRKLCLISKGYIDKCEGVEPKQQYACMYDPNWKNPNEQVIEQKQTSVSQKKSNTDCEYLDDKAYWECWQNSHKIQ